jgi:hypothetical protein
MLLTRSIAGGSMTGFQTILVAAGIIVGMLLLISFSAAIRLMRKIDRDLQRLRQLLVQASRDGAGDSYSRGDHIGGAQLAEIAIRQEQIADEYERILHPRRR